ncbi:unnamed protein product [Effrenium voratum]|uniref:VLIG-type G domain-containing protein n=1 Tax=Effrenium voratum TaxID=2562239 RepID=A0AA36JMP8_9DINO|nr:unnamed protein product [Effrenium voratum]
MAGYQAALESPRAGEIPCKGCFSVTAILAKIPPMPHGRWPHGLQMWRSGGSLDRGFCEFCEVMLGSSCQQNPDEATQALEPGNICLAELSRDKLQALVARSLEEMKEARGLTYEIQPYLEDLLIRRQGFRGFVDLLASVADAEETLPRFLSEMTAKDLFISLLLITPGRRKRIRLATAYQALKVPLPLVFRHPEAPQSGLKTARPRAAFELLQELACVPREKRVVLVSVGTDAASGCGKTTLLGAMGLAASEEDLDVRPSGPMHNSSCDLYCTNPDLWLLDAHGSLEDEDVRQAVLALHIWGSAIALVHCSLNDFHSSGQPRKDLASILSDLSGHVLLNAAPRRGSGAVVLVRDANEVEAKWRSALEAFSQLGVLAVFTVEDCRGFRSAARRSAAMEKLRAKLEQAWHHQEHIVWGTPCLEDLHKVHRLVVEGHLRRDAKLFSGAKAVLAKSSLGLEFTNILDRALKTGSVYESLFPLSAIKRRLRSLHHEGGERVTGASKMEQLKIEEDLAKARAAKMAALSRDFSSAKKSEALDFFQSSLSSTAPLSAVAELGHYLDDWKSPRITPLLAQQRAVLDKLAALEHVSEAKEKEEALLRAELTEVMNKLAELDFSADTFWTELELFAGRDGSDGVQRAAVCWASLLASGQPFQVLHSRPLQMAGQFLRTVLASIGAPAEPGIYVVSVIGAQSSAKSTLLNFLFGSGFAVASGRCTRGLYASYFVIHHRPVLVLDSEGLLSLGSEGSTFDGQIAMMCMTCSHLVLVNNKGELSRQLQDLLEVCLFAMKHLRLSRLQPRLVFVLRDQHDRSRAVHEDMLKQMKNNLEEAARTLGSPLQDLILLDGTAVFLLPSAMSSELRQGREVCWTSELFAREVLKLRSEVFRWLREDGERRAQSGGELPEFSSLVQWFDYATTVWETLDQFGQQLLHCRTIHEIEQRRELADVAKSAVREVLDGSAEQHAGFHERARQLVDSFVHRIHSSPTRFDLETTDLELSRALAYLRDEFVNRLEDLFQQKASSPRFSTTAKEQAKQQIRTPIEWAFENHLYTWKLHLKKASDERAMHELWIHFTGVLNRHLETSGHRSCLSEAESRQLFDAEWQMYEASFLDRLQSLTKDWQTLAHEVTLLFNHAVGKLQHETGALALLKEAGPQALTREADTARHLGKQTNEEWEENYFHIGWWGAMKMHGLALLHTAGGTLDPNFGTGLRNNVIPRMRQAVQTGLQQLRSEVHARQVLDEATAGEGLRHVANVILHDLETRLLADCPVTLKRPQILHALHLALRAACVEALEDVETDKQKKAMADLLAQKTLVEEHFLLIVQANKGDVERATNFATLYHRSLSSWLDHEVTQLAADVRSQVLQQMPDPQKSSEMAFQMSFGSRNWSDVLEYVLDTNAYLEKQFLHIFHQQKRLFVGPARSRVEKRVLGAYHLLQDVVGQWARKESTPTEKVDLAKGRAATASRSVKELKDFISIHAESVPTNVDIAEAHRQLAERLPATADFQIADPKLFAETLQARIGDCADSRDVPKRLGEQLQKALREQSLQAWSLIRGCSERCPLCGSKCDLARRPESTHRRIDASRLGQSESTFGTFSVKHLHGCCWDTFEPFLLIVVWWLKSNH